MRRKVDHDQSSAGPQDTRRLVDDASGILGVVQHHLQHRDIETRIGQRQPIHVRQPDSAVGQCSPGKPRAGQGQHRLACIHAQALAHTRGKQLEHAAGAGADIEQPASSRRNKLGERGLHRLGRQVERPHLVPVGALLLEAFRRNPCALGQHPRGLAAVGLQDRVVRRQAGDQLARERAILASRRGEPDIGALPHPLEQPRIAEQLQVAGQAGLRLAEDFGEFDDAESPSGRERQHSQPGRLGGSTQRGEQRLHAICMT